MNILGEIGKRSKIMVEKYCKCDHPKKSHMLTVECGDVPKVLPGTICLILIWNHRSNARNAHVSIMFHRMFQNRHNN